MQPVVCQTVVCQASQVMLSPDVRPLDQISLNSVFPCQAPHASASPDPQIVKIGRMR